MGFLDQPEESLGGLGRVGVIKDQCFSYWAPCEIHFSKRAISSGFNVLRSDAGGMMSSSLAFIRRIISEALGLPLMMTGWPFSRGSKANCSRSRRMGCFFGLRVAESGL